MNKNLFVLTGQEEEDNSTPYGWDDMPEFIQENNPSYQLIRVRFDSKKDVEEFAKLIDQTITEKTKSIRFPERDKSRNTLKRWISE